MEIITIWAISLTVALILGNNTCNGKETGYTNNNYQQPEETIL